MRCRCLLLALALPLAPGARAESVNLREAYPEQGAFVRVPSCLAGIPFGVAGALGGVFVCPGKALLRRRQAAHGGGVPSEPAPAAEFPGCVGGAALGGFYLGSAVGGFPFLALKRLFWDAPKAALKKESR